MSIESYRKALHFQTNLSPKELLAQLPANVEYNGISQAYDLEVNNFDLETAIAAMTLYIRQNYTGPAVVDNLPDWMTRKIDLEIDGEIGSWSAKCVPLLLLARDILITIELKIEPSVYHWWLWRYAQLSQQLIGKDKCPTLLKIFEDAVPAIAASDLVKEKSTKELFLCECIQSALRYYKYDESAQYLAQLEVIHGTNYKLSGAMGRRTKHQTFSCPQLFVENIQTNHEVGEYDKLESEFNILNHIIQDENALEEIKFDDKVVDNSFKLTSLGSAIVLNKMIVLMKTGPVKNRLDEEEQLAYLNYILKSEATACIKFEALRLRSLLETYKFAQAERGLAQVQTLANLYEKDDYFSLQHFFISNIPHRWELRRMLCKMFVKMGCIKSALEEYIALEMFTDACYCYLSIDRANEAKLLAEKQLEVDNLTNLEKADYLCVLGDIKNDATYYHRSWEIADGRHARSMRSLGTLLVHNKQYSEAAEAFEKALSLNHFNSGIWFIYGTCQFICENFKLAAKGFRSCVQIEYDNFEAWANLANCELKLGNKVLAHGALGQAIKCNFEKWELWENYLTISTDVCDINGAIRAYTRLLEIKPDKMFTDLPVLQVLSNAVVNNIEDISGHKSNLHTKKLIDLFDKIVSAKPCFIAAWRLYAKIVIASKEVAGNNGKQADLAMILQKSLQAQYSVENWFRSEKSLNDCIYTLKGLCSFVTSDGDKVQNADASTRLVLKSFVVKVRKVKNEETMDELDAIESICMSTISTIEELLKRE